MGLNQKRTRAEVEGAVKFAVTLILCVKVTNLGGELRYVLLALLEIEQVELAYVAKCRNHFLNFKEQT